MFGRKTHPITQDEMDAMVERVTELCDKGLVERIESLEKANAALNAELEIERRVNEALRPAMNLKSSLTV